MPISIHIKKVGLYAGNIKALTRYEIGQQADCNHRLERLLIEASVIPSLLCPTDGYQHPRWVYKGQRWLRSTDISEPDVNHTLCVPMGIRIGRVSLYAGTPNLDMLRNWLASRLQSLIGTPTDRSLCHISVTLSDRRISTKHWNLCQLRFSGRQMAHRHISIPYVCLWVYT